MIMERKGQGVGRQASRQAANSPKNGEEKKTRKYFNLTRQKTGKA
jgi:hypothetical protein